MLRIDITFTLVRTESSSLTPRGMFYPLTAAAFWTSRGGHLRCSPLLPPLYLPSFFIAHRIHSAFPQLFNFRHIPGLCSQIYTYDSFMMFHYRSLLVFRKLGVMLLCFFGRAAASMPSAPLSPARHPHYVQAVHRRFPSSTLSTKVEHI